MALSNKQKRHLLRQANKWLALKLKLESPFKKEIKSYFFSQSKIIARGGLLETIAPVLDKQYKRITREMTGIKLKAEGDFGLEDSLMFLLFGRATKQSEFIDRTTRQKLRLAEEMARENLREDGILFPSRKVLNKITAKIFRSLNSGRVNGIATFETQALTEKIHDTNQDIAGEMMNDAIVNNDKELAASAARLSESMTMEEVAEGVGEQSNSELFAALAIMKKTWVTMGDSKVRPWHQEANWQTVPVSEPFVVDNENLQYPGDTSMGASIANVANCRCHSSYL